MIDYHIHSDYSDGDQTIEEIIEKAKRKRLDQIAITDHISCDGNFMFLRHTDPPKPLKQYIREIREKSRILNYNVLVGVEISDFTDIETPLSPYFSEMDIILIETQKPRGPTDKSFDPIKKAIYIKNKFPNIPVGLAHPTIEFIENNIRRFDINNIFLELNGDKLSRSFNNSLDELLLMIKNILELNKNVKISVGSDAHQIYMVGSVEPIWNFLEKNKFLDRLIL
ncbi:MAG: PHP domain-containing protein [Candidatus Helarchaeota archaeon]